MVEKETAESQVKVLDPQRHGQKIIVQSKFSGWYVYLSRQSVANT